jgi:DNA-binding transcriptional ArsR family regulator
MKLEQSLTSSFLGLLRKAGVVSTRREGQVIFYAVNHKRLAEIERGAKLVIGSR